MQTETFTTSSVYIQIENPFYVCNHFLKKVDNYPWVKEPTGPSATPAEVCPQLTHEDLKRHTIVPVRMSRSCLRSLWVLYYVASYLSMSWQTQKNQLFKNTDEMTVNISY